MLLSAVGVLLALLAGQGPSNSPERCRLEGQVVNFVTGEPVRKALVTVRVFNIVGVDSDLFDTGTDSAGHFALDNLSPGSYSLTAERTGFQPTVYPKRRPGSRETLVLAAGDHKTDLVLPIVPLAVITGRVTEEDGDPVPGVIVSAMAYDYTDRGRQLVARNNARTNDLGEYRIYGLRPGRYYVLAVPPPNRSFAERRPPAVPGLAAAYYPAAEPSSASVLRLTPGQQLGGIDIALPTGKLPVLCGRVVKPDAAGDVRVQLIQHTNGGSSTTTLSVDDPEGKFVMRNITEGSYVIGASYRVGERQFEARMPLEVGKEDIEGIELRAIPPFNLGGQVRIEGSARVRISDLRVLAESDHDFPSPATVADNGAWTLRGMTQGLYHLNVLSPPAAGLYLKSIRLGTADILDSGLDFTAGPAGGEISIVLSANGGRIEGTVENENSEPVPGGMVTLVPDGPATPFRRQRLFKSTTTGDGGVFRFRGVTPGTYRLFAWDQVEPRAVEFDPEFVKPFEAAGKTLAVGENAAEKVTLPLIRAPEEN